MSVQTLAYEQNAEPTQQIDHSQVEAVVQQLRSQQNLIGGLLAGAMAALISAAAWAGITVAAEYQIGWMAVGVGFLVGLSIRVVGQGVDKIFGYAGAILALVGCVAGNFLAICGLIAKDEGIPFLEILAQMDVAFATDIMVASFSPIDLLFYAIALVEGYKLSFRELTDADLGALLPEPAVAAS